MITLHNITDPLSKLSALKNLADIFAVEKDCKKARRITLGVIRKMELRMETANKGEKNE